MNKLIKNPTKIIKVLYENNISGNKDLIYLKPKLDYSLEKSKESIDFYSIQQPKPNYKKIFDFDFFIISFKNDIRIQQFKIINDFIFLFFYSKEESVSFYNQHKNQLKMIFADIYDFEKSCLLGDFKNKIKIIYNSFYHKPESFLNKDFDHINININENTSISKKNEIKITSYKKFIDKIEYFNKMKNLYSKNDVKRMIKSLEANINDFVFLNTKELCVGSYSNVLIQNAIKKMDSHDLSKVIQNLNYDIVPISATKHGAYTIQAIILAVKNKETQQLISMYFQNGGEYLISHDIGNYSIQKILRYDNELVFNLLLKDLENICKNQLGLKVLIKCLEFFSNKKEILLGKLEELKDKIDIEIIENIKSHINK